MALLYRMGTGNGSGGDLKPFIINFTCDSGFIGKTVTMEFQGTPHAGETVDNVSGTVASDGTLTLYPMHDGLWKYYATSDVSGYHEETITLEKWGNYPVELSDIPNGATVTPTDNVQTWLHCANVWNKSYTTISEVVADTTTLNTLIANENANDYLVRSTTFATDICSNESAMTYIGLNDYCANKLLSDSTWLEAICNTEETLLKKVLNVYVPTLTSDSVSDGTVIYSSLYPNSVNHGYNAFDGKYDNDSSSGWASNSNAVGEYIGFKFVKPVNVRKILYISSLNDNRQSSRITVKYRDGSGNFTSVKTYDVGINTSLSFISLVVPDVGAHTEWIVYAEEGCTGYYTVRELQFYGREEA